MLRMTKHFLKKTRRKICEKFLNSKPVEFFLREIIKHADKWQEVIPNNSD